MSNRCTNCHRFFTRPCNLANHLRSCTNTNTTPTMNKRQKIMATEYQKHLADDNTSNDSHLIDYRNYPNKDGPSSLSIEWAEEVNQFLFHNKEVAEGAVRISSEHLTPSTAGTPFSRLEQLPPLITHVAATLMSADVNVGTRGASKIVQLLKDKDVLFGAEIPNYRKMKKMIAAACDRTSDNIIEYANVTLPSFPQIPPESFKFLSIVDLAIEILQDARNGPPFFWEPPPPQNGGGNVYSGLLSGDWFRKMHAERPCKARFHHILPIILYFDDTTCDWRGSKKFKPIVITVGNISHSARMSIPGKRMVGYYPHLLVRNV